MTMMMNNKRILISNLLKKLGFEDEDLNQLIEILGDEQEKTDAFKESVCDTVNAYHNEKKEMKVLIEEMITILSAAKEYDNDRSAYTEKQRQLLWDTSSDTLVKAIKVLSKY